MGVEETPELSSVNNSKTLMVPPFKDSELTDSPNSITTDGLLELTSETSPVEETPELSSVNNSKTLMVPPSKDSELTDTPISKTTDGMLEPTSENSPVEEIPELSLGFSDQPF